MAAVIVCAGIATFAVGCPRLMKVETRDNVDLSFGRFILMEFNTSLDRYKTHHNGKAPRSLDEFRAWKDFTENWSLDEKEAVWQRLRYPVETTIPVEREAAVAAYVHDNGVWQYLYSDGTISP